MTRYYVIPSPATELEWDGEPLTVARMVPQGWQMMRAGILAVQHFMPLDDRPEDAAILAAWERYCEAGGESIEAEAGCFWFLPARVPCPPCNEPYDGGRLEDCELCEGTCEIPSPHGIAQDEIVPEDDDRLALSKEFLKPWRTLLEAGFPSEDVIRTAAKSLCTAGIRAISASGRQDYRRE